METSVQLYTEIGLEIDIDFEPENNTWQYVANLD